MEVRISGRVVAAALVRLCPDAAIITLVFEYIMLPHRILHLPFKTGPNLSSANSYIRSIYNTNKHISGELKVQHVRRVVQVVACMRQSYGFEADPGRTS